MQVALCAAIGATYRALTPICIEDFCFTHAMRRVISWAKPWTHQSNWTKFEPRHEVVLCAIPVPAQCHYLWTPWQEIDSLSLDNSSTVLVHHILNIKLKERTRNRDLTLSWRVGFSLQDICSTKGSFSYAPVHSRTLEKKKTWSER